MTRSLILLQFVLAYGSPMWGQSTFGSILGVVRDPGGSVMPGVRVVVTNEGSGVSKEVSSDAAGNHEVTHLNPGYYRITAESAGFQRFVNEHVPLETNQVLRIDLTMQVGQVTDTITVTSQAPVIESETGTISDVRTGRQMQQLPLNFVRGDAFGGGIFKYMSLSPGSFPSALSTRNQMHRYIFSPRVCRSRQPQPMQS